MRDELVRRHLIARDIRARYRWATSRLPDEDREGADVEVDEVLRLCKYVEEIWSVIYLGIRC